MPRSLQSYAIDKSCEQLTEVEIGISGRCNAGCVDCERWTIVNQTDLYVNKNNPALNKIIDRETAKQLFQKIKRLKNVLFIGTTGDPLSHPELDLICQDIIDMYPKVRIQMHTNGSLGKENVWKNLAGMNNVHIEFAIDGLEDTNHIYRRNVKWDSVMRNAKLFIETGGNAEWKFVAFPHNRHQILRARKMSKDLGFQNFNLVSRHSPTVWMDNLILRQSKNKIPTSFYEGTTKKYVDYKEELEKNLQKFIQSNGMIEPECASNYRTQNDPAKVKQKNTPTKIFIEADGTVWPCCFIAVLDFYSNDIIGSHWQDKKQFFLNKYGENFNNLFYHPLENILKTELFPPYITNKFTDLKNATIDDVMPACIINCGKCKFYDPVGSETDHSLEFFMHRN